LSVYFVKAILIFKKHNNHCNSYLFEWKSLVQVTLYDEWILMYAFVYMFKH